MTWNPDAAPDFYANDHRIAAADDPLLGPEADPDYLTLVGLGFLALTVAWLVALCWPLLT